MALSPRRLGLLTKLHLSMAVVALPLLLLYPLYVLPTLRAQHRADRVRALRQTVETAYGVLESYEARVSQGELSRSEAQAQAVRLLQGLRYDGVGYFWVNDLSTQLVMHPDLPHMLGKDLQGYRDANGKAVFVDIVTLARAQGEGSITYMATRPGESTPLPKESYIKLFPPWGWVLGTGVYVEDIDEEVTDLQQRLLIAMGLALLLVGLMGRFFSRAMVQPVSALADAANRVARGDLSVTVPVSSEDEVGRLGQAVNTMLDGIRETVRGLAEVATSTAAHADRIRGSADVLSHATREQADQLQQAAMSVQDMSRSISQGAMQALTTAAAAAGNGQVAKEGGEAVDHASRKILEIVQVVQSSEQMVSRLQASSTVVGRMLQLIQDVSNETNILAVNTAIEAARAGEHGKGFGVVASEVRKLAQRTREAVLQIEQLLRQNREDTAATVELMRQGTTKVEEGVQLSSAAGRALARIVIGAEQIHARVGELASEGSRQSSSGENIAERIKSLSLDSLESAKGVEEIAQAVVDLHAQAQQLRALAARLSSQPEPAPEGEVPK